MLSGNASLAVLCFAELSLYLSEEKLFVTNFSSMSTGKFFQLAAQFTLCRDAFLNDKKGKVFEEVITPALLLTTHESRDQTVAGSQLSPSLELLENNQRILVFVCFGRSRGEVFLKLLVVSF